MKREWSLKKERERIAELKNAIYLNLDCIYFGRSFPVYGVTKKIGSRLYNSLTNHLLGVLYLEWNDALNEVVGWLDTEHFSCGPDTKKWFEAELIRQLKIFYPKMVEAQPTDTRESYYEPATD